MANAPMAVIHIKTFLSKRTHGDAVAASLSPPWTRGNLQGQCVLDTSARVSSGIFIYLVLWICVCLPVGLHESHPVWVWGNAIGLAAIALGRTWFTALLPALVEVDTRLANRALSASILLNGLYWGVLTGVSVIHPVGNDSWWAMLLISVGMCAAGTVVMGINTSVRAAYPATIQVPVIACALTVPTSRNLLLAALAFVFSIYMVKASKTIYRDYWEALEGRVNAEHRARQFEELSAQDALTGLRNRMSFDRQFAADWEATILCGAAISVLMVDLDHFKKVNDRYGHLFGDICLKEAAQALRGAVRKTGNAVARYGGEEFVILLPDTNEEAARSIAQRCLDKVRSIDVAHDGQKVPLTCSIGVATAAPVTGDRSLDLLRRADEAVYRAKAEGRNRWCAA